MKNKDFVFVGFRLHPTSELNTFDSDFNCAKRKSTLSVTTVFLLQVMRFAKLNKPPPSFKPSLSIKPPPQKYLKKISPPGDLIEDLRYCHIRNVTGGRVCGVRADLRSLVLISCGCA